MQDQIVSFDTAKLACEKGFNNNWDSKDNYHCFYGYDLDPSRNKEKKKDVMYFFGDHSNTWNLQNHGWPGYNAPTQSLLQKWLRDKHHIHVEVSWDTVSYDVYVFHPDLPVGQNREMHNTYEEALEVGLIEGLKLI
jgi:hypothetical protein